MKKGMLLSLPVLLTVSMTVQAAMYRWTADDGSVVYSAKPPEDGRAATTVVAPPPPAGKSSSQLAEEKARQDAARNKGNPALDQELRKENCENARSNLALIRNATAGDTFKNADGEDVSFSADELAAKIRENEVAEKAFCD